MSQKRGNFTSSLGFILAAAGSAIGLGNLWKFPYVAGNNGGGLFFLLFIVFTLILGIPIILAEMAIGRKTQLSTVGAYKSLNKNWAFVGGIGVLCSFIILSYYSVVGGWVLKYIFTYLTGANFGASKPGYFEEFIKNPVEPAIWHLIFMGICAVIILGGVVKGIEQASKIMLPGLFILIIIIAIRSVTLDGAVEGLKFLFIPNLEAFNSFSHLANTIASAMGQVFFSLSLGLGITITYGSYLKKDSNLQKDTIFIVGADTLIAIFSGLTVLPAVFAFGFKPTSGPGLIFETLPAVFESMPFGAIFGLLFFILVFFAAATSAMALLEVVAAFFIDTFGWKRKKATLLMASIMAVIGIFASLSMGRLEHIHIFDLNLFDAMGFLTDKILMPIAAMLMCIFVGYVLGTEPLAEEIECGAKGFKLKKVFSVIIKYVAPILILIIFVMGLFPQ